MTKKQPKPRPTKKPRSISDARVNGILDEIKDEIDTLNRITNIKQRKDMARDLIEYIELYYVFYVEEWKP